MSEPMTPQNDGQRFEELLPFYVTRQLPDADKAFVEAYMAANPSSRDALHFTEQLSQVVRSIGADRHPELALQKLFNNLTPAHQNLLQRVIAQWRAAGRGWRILIVLAAAALLGVASAEAWLEALIGLLGELGFADAVVIML
jgi:anti-sigma factor RsiW